MVSKYYILFSTFPLVASLYQIVLKSQAFLLFSHFSSAFYIELFYKLCKLKTKIFVVSRLILRYLVSKSYICLHKLSQYVISCKNQLPTDYALCLVPSRAKSHIPPAFSRCRGLTFRKKCAIFSLSQRLWRRHAFPVRFPERSLYAAMALFPCRGRSPLPSRMCGNAMPGAPVTASMSDGPWP